LKENYVDCFGVLIELLIVFGYTKGNKLCNDFFLTTGGISGSEKINKFQPRSFNMGLSRKL
jgi:hypothetical protein